MAKKKEVVITCNATNVKAVIEGLERGMAALAKEEERLLNTIKQRGYAENDEKKRLKELEKAMDAMRTNVQKNREEQKKLAEVMKDLSGAKLKDLKKALQEGKAALNNMSARDPGRQKLVSDLQRIQKQIEANTGALKSHGSAWQMAVKNITAYVGVFGMFNFVKNKITEVIRGGAELSDQMAQVRMVSGLAMQDIEDLTRTLAKMDTRTTLSELERIAYAGAKLGFGEYGTKGLEEFVRAANQVNVALREDLGEEALTALSKITENMGLIKKMGVEDAMLATSSAMFKLAATSTAAAGPIVEVTKRLVPVAQASGMATHEILALASAADSLQLMPEVVGTALSKLLMAMQNNHNLIESTLGINEGTIARMIKAGDVMDAMLMIFDKMSGKNMTELSGIWKLLGSDGQRLITVVQAMANHTDTLRKHLETSTQAFREATAVTEEYNIQQETAAALFQRASNLWRNAMVNADTSLSVKEMAKSWYDFSKSVLDSEFSLGAIKVTIDALLGSIRLLINLLPMIAFGLMAKGAAMLAVKLSTAKMAVDGFTLSWKKMDAATKSNWISLAIGIFAQLAFSIAQWAKSNEEAEASQKMLNLAIDSATEKAEQEINAMSQLKTQIEDTTLSQEDRLKLFSKFKTDYDIYLNYLGIELNSVDELAKHYDALAKVMRQRFAYQEREDYKRDVMGGEGGLRMKRRSAGSDLTRSSGDVGKKVDLSVIDMYARNNVSMQEAFNRMFPDIDRAIGNIQKSESTARAFGGNTGPRTDGIKKYTDFQQKFNEYYEALSKELKKEKEIDSAFAQEIGDFDYDKWLRTQVKGDFKIKPDKELEKQRRKEEAARRKALREEMKEEQTQAKAIIDNVKNYYQRQLNAITEMANLGTIDKTTQEQMTDGMTQRMNEALANVRKAIGGTENDWEEFKRSMRDDLYEPLGENGENLSTELLDKIMDNNLVKLREMIQKLSKELNQQGNVLLDQILRKATENEGKNVKVENKLMRAREKELLARNYTGKVDYDYQNTMEQFGIAGITTEQSRYIRDWSQKGDEQNIKKFFEDRTKLWQEGFEQAREKIVELYSMDMETEEDGKKLLQILFGADYEQKLSGSALEGMLKNSLQQWKVFYYKLLEYNDQWIDAQKKAYDESKKRQDYLFKNRPDIHAIDEMAKALEQRQKQLAKSGDDKGTGWLQRAGFTALSEDPELARYQLLEEKAKLYYETMERLRQQDLVSEQMVQDAKNNMIAAQTALQEHLIAQLNDRMTKLQEWAAPIEQMGTDIGQAMYDQWHNGESMNDKWQDMLKKMALSWGQLTVKITSELMMQKIKQKLMNRAMQAEETAHQTTMTTIQQAGEVARTTISRVEGGAKVAAEQATNTTIEGEAAAHNATMIAEDKGMAVSENAINTSRAAGKTLADLGWWGIPLVAVITALLNMLLQAALGTSKSDNESSSSSASTKAATKTKLVSGMLTYDKGNIDRFAGRRKLYDDGETQVYGRRRYLGEDGKVYTATAEPAPKDGLVTHPIATTVQGQPALVAEKGPEIVIGRETTKAIMMNEPELIKYLANYQQHGGSQGYSTARGLAAYDSGNVQSVATTQPSATVPDGSPSGSTSDPAAERQALINRLDRSDALMEQVLYFLQNPIPPEIAMYDTGGKKGLRTRMHEADRFMARYGG